MNVEGGREAARELLALPLRRRPTGVFCANDLLALGVLQELFAAGVRIGEEVAVVGYDDIALTVDLRPALTTVRANSPMASPSAPPAIDPTNFEARSESIAPVGR